MQLVCDKREKILNYFPQLDWIVQDTLVTGDYAIIRDSQVHFVFERKTWQDLAASIKDGRIFEQRKRLKALQCPVYIIIEGKMSYSPDTMVGGIEFHKLDAMRRKLMMIGLPHVQTKNAEGTVQFLVEFTKQYAAEDANTNAIGASELKKPAELSKQEIINNIWTSIPGIGPNLLDCLKDISIMDCILGTDAWQKKELKYNSGRRCNSKDKINTWISDPANTKYMVAVFPKIGQKTAEKIASRMNLQDFIKSLTPTGPRSYIYELLTFPHYDHHNQNLHK